MHVTQRGLMPTLIITILVVSSLAEAKRVGAGENVGMSRTHPYSNQSSPVQQRPSATAVAQTARASGSNTGKMLVAGVAGAAIGAVAVNTLANNDTTSSHNTSQPSSTATTETFTAENNRFDWLWIVLVIIAVFYLLRRLSTKKTTAHHNPFAPNLSANQLNNTSALTHHDAKESSSAFSLTGDNMNIFGQTVGSSGTLNNSTHTNSGNKLPDSTESAIFLHQARVKFLHFQSMNNVSNVEEIRYYFTPEMYLAICNDILSKSELAEFPQLNTQLVDAAVEDEQFIASVRFSGLVRESNAEIVPFTETWHFIKNEPTSEWLVTDIQHTPHI
jgi:predicted lipid-binding transport protein (Tim44 family)